MAASIFVDPCIKVRHRKGPLIRRAAETLYPFGGGWASALWSDVVGDYREYTSESDESQIFLYWRSRTA
jgi:hypothetical protein